MKLLTKCLLLLSLLLLTAVSGWTQMGVRERQPYVDLRRSYLGFRLGLHSSDVALTQAGFSTPEGVRLWSESPSYHPGFSIGVIGGWVLRPNLEVRLLPTLHFGDAPVRYSDGTREVEQTTLRTNYLQLPLELKWSGGRVGNYRPYLSAGPYVSMALSGRDGDLLRLKRWDAGLHVGLGCDIYFGFFKLSPQLSYHYGLVDALQHQRPDLRDDNRLYYTLAIGSARMRMWLLTLSFE